MANAGNAGFTGSVKGLTALFFIVVLVSIFVSFWIGYSTVFFDSSASTNWAAAQIAAIVFITLDFVVVLALLILTFWFVFFFLSDLISHFPFFLQHSDCHVS